MAVSTRTEIVGAKEAIKALRKIDPELRKQFNRDAKAIVAPIIDDAKNNYPQNLLSGMQRRWTQRGNQKFPYDAAKARKGLKFKVDTSRRGGSTIRVQQMDPAASIIEFAGKKTANRLASGLDRFARPARFMWPAAEKELPAVAEAVQATIEDALKEINRKLLTA